jgi:dolichol-phosphate mannosyltransferase
MNKEQKKMVYQGEQGELEDQNRISSRKNIGKGLANNDKEGILINSYPDDLIPQFALLMPVHNEENSITDVVIDAYNELVKNKMSSFEIILSEDGSTDNTREVIINLSKKIPLKAILSDKRKGYSGGIKEGLKLVSASCVIISDSDGQHRPADFWILKDRFEKLGYPNDVIISGIRKVRADALHRKIISRTFQKLNSIVFDLASLKDITSPFKLMSTNLAKSLASECKFMNESFWTEFVVRACHKNISIVEVEVEHRNRLNDESVVYKKSKIPRIVISQVVAVIKLKKDVTGKGFVSSILQTKSIRRLISFALVGLSGAAIVLFLTWLGVNFHLHYVLSAAIGIETSIVWAFMLNERFTFRDKVDDSPSSRKYLRFLKYNASSLGGEAINLTTLFLITSAGLFYLYSEMVAILVAFTFNYTLSNKWVWRSKR